MWVLSLRFAVLQICAWTHECIHKYYGTPNATKIRKSTSEFRKSIIVLTKSISEFGKSIIVFAKSITEFDYHVCKISRIVFLGSIEVSDFDTVSEWVCHFLQ